MGLRGFSPWIIQKRYNSPVPASFICWRAVISTVEITAFFYLIISNHEFWNQEIVNSQCIIPKFLNPQFLQFHHSYWISNCFILFVSYHWWPRKKSRFVTLNLFQGLLRFWLCHLPAGRQGCWTNTETSSAQGSAWHFSCFSTFYEFIIKQFGNWRIANC